MFGWFADKLTRLKHRLMPHLKRAAEIALVNSLALERLGDKVAEWEPDDVSRHLNTAAEAAARLQLIGGSALGPEKFAAAIAGIKATDIALKAADDRFDKGWEKANAKLDRLQEWLQAFVDSAKDQELLGFKRNKQPVATAS